MLSSVHLSICLSVHIFLQTTSPPQPINQIQNNFTEMFLRGPSFKKFIPWTTLVAASSSKSIVQKYRPDLKTSLHICPVCDPLPIVFISFVKKHGRHTGKVKIKNLLVLLLARFEKNSAQIFLGGLSSNTAEIIMIR